MGNSTSHSATWQKHPSLLRADHMSQFQFKVSKDRPVKVFPSFPHPHLRATENGALLQAFGTVTSSKLPFSKLISFRNKRNKVLRPSYLHFSPVDDECKVASDTEDFDSYCNLLQNGNKLEDASRKENHCLRRHKMRNNPNSKDFDVTSTSQTDYQCSREVHVVPHLERDGTNHANDAKCVTEPTKPISKRNIKKFYYGMKPKQSSLLYDKYSLRRLCKSMGVAAHPHVSSNDSYSKRDNDMSVSNDACLKHSSHFHKLSRALASRDHECLKKTNDNGTMTFMESAKCVDGHEKSGDSGISGDTSSPWPVDYNRNKITNSSAALHLSDYSRHYNGEDISTDSSGWPSPVHSTPPKIQRCSALPRSTHFPDKVRRINENWLLVLNKCKRHCCNEESSDSCLHWPESKNFDSVIAYDMSSKNPNGTKQPNELTSEGCVCRSDKQHLFQKKAASKKVYRMKKFKHPIFLSLPTLTECNQKCETPCETNSCYQECNKNNCAKNYSHVKNVRRLQAADPLGIESRSRTRHKSKYKSNKEDLSPTLFSSLSISSSSPDVRVCPKKNLELRREPVNYKDWTSLSVLESHDFLDKRPASQPYSRGSRGNLNVATSKNKAKYKSESDGRPTPSRHLKMKKNVLSYPEIVCDIPKVPYFLVSDLKQRRPGILRRKPINYEGSATDDGFSTSEVSTPSSRVSGIIRYAI